MYFYPNRGLRHIFIALIFGVNWIILTCPGVKCKSTSPRFNLKRAPAKPTILSVRINLLDWSFAYELYFLALQCYHCDPCENEDGGTLKTCNEKAYEGLPDQGYMGCASELGSSGKLKKDCIWLRNDPDEPTVPLSPRPMRCHTSTFDDVTIDCYCFQNFCNKHKLSPSGYSADHEAGTPPPKSTAHSTKFQVPRQWMLFSSLGIVLLSQRKGFC